MRELALTHAESVREDALKVRVLWLVDWLQIVDEVTVFVSIDRAVAIAVKLPCKFPEVVERNGARQRGILVHPEDKLAQRQRPALILVEPMEHIVRPRLACGEQKLDEPGVLDLGETDQSRNVTSV